MDFRLVPKPVTRQDIVQRCHLCHQPVDHTDAEQTFDVNSFGAEKYVICVCCNKPVPEQSRTAAYWSAWDREFGELQKKAARVQIDGSAESASDTETMTPNEWIRERLAFEARVAKRNG